MLRKLSQGSGQPDELDVFVSEQNIALYRRLLDTQTDTERRRKIIGMLRAEFAKLRRRSNGRDPSGSVA